MQPRAATTGSTTNPQAQRGQVHCVSSDPEGLRQEHLQHEEEHCEGEREGKDRGSGTVCRRPPHMPAHIKGKEGKGADQPAEDGVVQAQRAEGLHHEQQQRAHEPVRRPLHHADVTMVVNFKNQLDDGTEDGQQGGAPQQELTSAGGSEEARGRTVL